MIAWLHRLLAGLSALIGPWIYSLAARIIATGYYFFIPRRVLASARVYRALYPSRATAYHLLCVWRQYHSFTRVVLDRMLLVQQGRVDYESRGMEFLEQAAADGTGGIIVMSHMGNWDVAAHLLRERGLPLMLYMGSKEKEQLERTQKEELRHRGVRIVAVGKDGGSPFDLIEGLAFLRSGGLVALTGDIVWKSGQRSIDAVFLGHRVALPAAPYILSQKTGAPLLFFFSFRAGPGRYTFIIRDPLSLEGGRRGGDEAVRKAAQKYADILADELSRHPFEWYHFDHFLGEKIGPPGLSAAKRQEGSGE
jgi:lauroyl/myristoyl acyltransferase